MKHTPYERKLKVKHLEKLLEKWKERLFSAKTDAEETECLIAIENCEADIKNWGVMMKKKISIRIDEELLDLADELDLHLPLVFTEALQRATRTKTCPTCKQKIKKKGKK